MSKGKCLASYDDDLNYKKIEDPSIVPAFCPIENGEIAVHESEDSKPKDCTGCYYYQKNDGRYA